MEKGQLDKAIELKRRLDGLEEAKKEISNKTRHRVSYIEK